MNKLTKTLLLGSTLLMSMSSMAESINSRDFISCFEKAMNERIEEIKEASPGVTICDSMGDENKQRLTELYTEVTADGELQYYSASSMGLEDVRFHYERVMFDIACYPTPSNILTAWVEGFADAVGLKDHTNFELTKSVFSKMLGRNMWTENGSDLYSEHDFSYCFQD